MEEMQKELDALIAKREILRERQMATFHSGSATRAKTTTANANVDRVNERIIFLREELKKAAKRPACTSA